MMDLSGVPVDSREGITILIQWAREGRFVLSGAHERIARKWGVSTDGVIISRASK